MKTNFTKGEIRKFLVLYYGLNDLDSFGMGKEGIINYFDRVHSIQSDPLNIAGKNTEIILAARFSQFTPTMLDEMLYTDKTLVDSFDKEACLHLMSDWKDFSHVREKLISNNYWKQYNLDHIDHVYAYIESNPKSCSKDIRIGSVGNDNWGSTSLSNRILDYLWFKGDIAIDERKSGNKYYSLSSSVIPEMYYVRGAIEKEAFFEWFTLRRLEALGVYWLKRGAGWLSRFFDDIQVVKDEVYRLVEEGKVIEIEVDEMKVPLYLTARNYNLLMDSLDKELEETIRFIAPLDNFIWDRKLVKELFGFEYTWEVYVPESKRKYGYYVLPVLYKDQLIARIEPSRDKKRRNKLKIEKIWYEDKTYKTKEIKDLLNQEVKRFNHIMK